MLGWATTVSAPGIAIAAGEVATGGSLWETVISGGIGPVFVAALFLTGQVVRGKTYDAMEQRALAAEQRAQTLADQAITQVVPELTRVSDVLNKVVPLLPPGGR